MLEGWRTLLELYRTRRMTRQICATLQPFIDAESLADDVRRDILWSRADRLGFLTSVISRIVWRADDQLSSDALGLLQGEVVRLLTGLSPEVAGERLLVLSLNNDADFLAGCANGLAFAEALAATRNRFDDPSDELAASWQSAVEH